MRQLRGTGPQPDGMAAGAEATPGKRTLTESLPRPGAGQSLPEPVQAKMERSFGADFSAVRVHQGEHASALSAAAYTEGHDLHFAPGQYQPGSARGDELIGHELAHVVQQGEGRVAATTQFKGLDGNDDAVLEREADAWGARAARGEPVGRSGALGGGGAAIQRKVVQRSPQPSHSGRFLDSKYEQLTYGVEVILEFEPGPEVDATKIGMTQAVKETVGGSDVQTDPRAASRHVKSGPGKGYEIDQAMGRDNPLYDTASVGGNGDLATTPDSSTPGEKPEIGKNTHYVLGHRHGNDVQNAQMLDRPQRTAANDSTMEFETTAVAVEGPQKDTYYGSVRWGWHRDSAGNLSKLPFTLVSQGVPSESFLAAAAAWNAGTAGGTLQTSKDPTMLYNLSGSAYTPKMPLDKGTIVVSQGSRGAGALEYHQVYVKSGPHRLESGYVLASDMVDRGDGPDTADLPSPHVETLRRAQTLNGDVPGPWESFAELPAGTRVQRMLQNPVHAGPDQVYVRIVDGPNTGREGYVPAAILAPEG